MNSSRGSFMRAHPRTSQSAQGSRWLRSTAGPEATGSIRCCGSFGCCMRLAGLSRFAGRILAALVVQAGDRRVDTVRLEVKEPTHFDDDTAVDLRISLSVTTLSNSTKRVSSIANPHSVLFFLSLVTFRAREQ